MFIKGVNPDFCLSEFGYYSNHIWIWKAIYSAAYNSPRYVYFDIFYICAIKWNNSRKFKNANSKGFWPHCEIWNNNAMPLAKLFHVHTNFLSPPTFLKFVSSWYFIKKNCDLERFEIFAVEWKSFGIYWSIDLPDLWWYFRKCHILNLCVPKNGTKKGSSKSLAHASKIV